MARMLAGTQSRGNFFITQFGTAGREVARKITLLVAGTPTDCTFKQPFTDAVFRATTHLADLAQQGRQMNGIAKPSGQRRAAQRLNCFHVRTITWRG